MTAIPFPGPVGGVIVLSVGDLVPEFKVGDVCSFSISPAKFRVVKVDGVRVHFERIS